MRLLDTMNRDWIWTETRTRCYKWIFSHMDESGKEYFTMKPALGNTQQENWVKYVTGVVNEMKGLCDNYNDRREMSTFKNYHLHKGNDPYDQYEKRFCDPYMWHRITLHLEHSVNLFEHVLYLIEREHHFWPIAKDILRQIFNGNDDVVEKIYCWSRAFEMWGKKPSLSLIDTNPTKPPKELCFGPD